MDTCTDNVDLSLRLSSNLGRKYRPTSREYTMPRTKLYGQRRGDRNSLSIEANLPSTSHANSGKGLEESSEATASVHILDLPTELIETILSYSSYEQISKLRRVCTRFNEVGSSLLNSAFQRLQNNMLQRFHKIKSQMPRRESARRTHPLARECDIVETVHMRLTLLQMTFGKYIEKKFCCFWPGEILDEVYRIFHYIKTTPNLARAYKVTDELFDLTTMAMEYFKEYVEPHLPEITYFATDFLDYTTFSTAGIKPSTWKSSTPIDSVSCSNSPAHVEEHPEIPSANTMLKKKLKVLRQGMKKNNSQLTVLKRELGSYSNKMADQQKQLMEYSSRFEDYDKKFEENSRKFSAVLQELNKCKTELQYWRSKSPANQLSCPCCSTVPDGLKPNDEAAIEGGDSIHNLPGLVSSPDRSFPMDGFIPIPVEDELMEGGTCSIEDQTSECLFSETTEVIPARSNARSSTKQKSSEIIQGPRLNLRSKRKVVDEVKEPLVKRLKKKGISKGAANIDTVRHFNSTKHALMTYRTRFRVSDLSRQAQSSSEVDRCTTYFEAMCATCPETFTDNPRAHTISEDTQCKTLEKKCLGSFCKIGWCVNSETMVHYMTKRLAKLLHKLIIIEQCNLRNTCAIYEWKNYFQENSPCIQPELPDRNPASLITC